MTTSVNLTANIMTSSMNNHTTLSIISTSAAPSYNSSNDALTSSCNLVGWFGVIMQGAIGIVAFSTLILKRLKEPKGDRRPWRIWAADVIKQALGMLMLHFVNVALAALLQTVHSDECVWYLTNFMLDSTIGLFFIFIFLLLSRKIVIRYKLAFLISGEYGYPFKIHFWLAQLANYMVILLAVKVVMLVLAILPFWAVIGNAILFFKNPELRTAVVMFLIPFIVDVVMFWIVDSVLMGRLQRANGSKPQIIHFKKFSPSASLESSEESILVLTPDDD